MSATRMLAVARAMDAGRALAKNGGGGHGRNQNWTDGRPGAGGGGGMGGGAARGGARRGVDAGAGMGGGAAPEGKGRFEHLLGGAAAGMGAAGLATTFATTAAGAAAAGPVGLAAAGLTYAGLRAARALRARADARRQARLDAMGSKTAATNEAAERVRMLEAQAKDADWRADGAYASAHNLNDAQRQYWRDQAREARATADRWRPDVQGFGPKDVVPALRNVASKPFQAHARGLAAEARRDKTLADLNERGADHYYNMSQTHPSGVVRGMARVRAVALQMHAGDFWEKAGRKARAANRAAALATAIHGIDGLGGQGGGHGGGPALQAQRARMAAQSLLRRAREAASRGDKAKEQTLIAQAHDAGSRALQIMQGVPKPGQNGVHGIMVPAAGAITHMMRAAGARRDAVRSAGAKAKVAAHQAAQGRQAKGEAHRAATETIGDLRARTDAATGRSGDAPPRPGARSEAPAATQSDKMRSAAPYAPSGAPLRDGVGEARAAAMARHEASLAYGYHGPRIATNGQEAAVPVRRSLTNDHVVSLEDGSRHADITEHLREKGMTPEQYREKWALPLDYPMQAPGPQRMAERRAQDDAAASAKADERKSDRAARVGATAGRAAAAKPKFDAHAEMERLEAGGERTRLGPAQQRAVLQQAIATMRMRVGPDGRDGGANPKLQQVIHDLGGDGGTLHPAYAPRASRAAAAPTEPFDHTRVKAAITSGDRAALDAQIAAIKAMPRGQAIEAATAAVGYRLPSTTTKTSAIAAIERLWNAAETFSAKAKFMNGRSAA